MIRNRALLTLLLVFFSTVVIGQEDERPVAQDLLGRLDFSVPQSPAFTVLGLSPEEVIVPTSYRTLALSLLDGLDANGNAQTGLAVDTKPYVLAQGPSLTLDRYRANRWNRMLSRLQVSFATSSGQEQADQADRYALSVRLTPWDQGDPRMDFNPQKLDDPDTLEGCYRQVLVLIEDEDKTTFDPKIFDEASLTANDRELASKAQQCVRASEERNWNASSWDIGLASFRVDNDDLNEAGFAAWTSVALSAGTRGQVVMHARYQEDVLVPQENSTSLLNGWRAGVRLRYGKPRGALMIEAVHIENEDENGDSTDGIQYLIGTEMRLTERFWLQLALGDRTGDLDDSNDSYLSGQLRWAFSEDSLRQ